MKKDKTYGINAAVTSSFCLSFVRIQKTVGELERKTSRTTHNRFVIHNDFAQPVSATNDSERGLGEGRGKEMFP
ncbi:hypothetical protein, partial [Pseudoalteromonas distincta]|uniref:hypothetical protein n=1 Tax=Pseudoalteromonas distincta TaxID=77608 RepID=UPI0034E8DAED